MEGEPGEGRSLSETPNWAVATVITVMVVLGFFFQGSLKRCGKWLHKTKRKPLLAALDKIKEELMLFGLLSLLMGHWIAFVAKICVKSSVFSSRFYPCALEGDLRSVKHIPVPGSDYLNKSVVREHVKIGLHDYCPELLLISLEQVAFFSYSGTGIRNGHEPFASHESLEQLHRLTFVLGIIHVSYSFFAIALAMIKIYSWKPWENEAKSMAIQSLQETPLAAPDHIRMRRLSTFINHRTSHPWSEHRVLVWLLCFTRQFWSSINRADYMALRAGFITTHQLPLSYDFHNYMLRSMEEEFRDIVGINVPLWIYAICCIFLDFHGSNVYFWLSFLPAILILLVGTKLHRVVIKLAVEIMDKCPLEGFHQFNLRDELFWFGRPKCLLWLIHLISFQNAFEMATCIWSLMGSRYNKSVVSKNVRNSLTGWQRRVKAKNASSISLLSSGTTASQDSTEHDKGKTDDCVPNSMEGSTARDQAPSLSCQQTSLENLLCGHSQIYAHHSSDDDDPDSHDDDSDVNDDLCLLPPA
ncbi:MLO-like protein 4 [Morella rubra]|uniref:MLO-like protein n=1 Tax=Morella rubra TaxID=262757 RepID=A0A6A1UPV3_9ROSI|nr:MLO-like protein 4 [Morella rubra]